jgi:hypothetical protein
VPPAPAAPPAPVAPVAPVAPAPAPLSRGQRRTRAIKEGLGGFGLLPSERATVLVSKPGRPNVVDPGKATALFKLLKRQAGELFDLRETHARTDAAADALRESGRPPLLDQLAERIVEDKYEAAHIFWQKLACACALYNMSMPPKSQPL